MSNHLKILKIPLMSGEAFRAIRDIGKTPAMDEFVERELGGGRSISKHDECLVCGKLELETYEQILFRGPFGKQAVGGPQSPEYLRIEIRQECNHCKVQLWKIPPERFVRL